VGSFRRNEKSNICTIHQNTWITVPRSEIDNVIKSTWAFKLKRLPDGTPSNRGDLQKEGIDYFVIYMSYSKQADQLPDCD